jgi:hypothetical protein
MQIIPTLNVVRAYHDQGIAVPDPLITAVFQTMSAEDMITFYATMIANEEYRPLIGYFRTIPGTGPAPEDGEDAEIGPYSHDAPEECGGPTPTRAGVVPMIENLRGYV